MNFMIDEDKTIVLGKITPFIGYCDKEGVS